MKRIRKVLRYYHNPRRLALLACSAVLVIGLGSVKGMSYIGTQGKQASYESNDTSLQGINNGLASLRQSNQPSLGIGPQQEQDSSDEQNDDAATQELSSFTTKITYGKPVISGTLVAYNAADGIKTYYGGDLDVNKAKVIYDKGQTDETGQDNRTVFVSSPDGHDLKIPQHPAYDTSPYGFLSLATENTGAGPFKMLVRMNQDTPTGTYVLHISTARRVQEPDIWQYDGFLTVEVIDSSALNTGQTPN